MQEWKSWCRLCASDEANDIDIFFEDLERSCSIAEDLKRLCNLKLENTTDLSSKICNNCNLSVKNLKEFLENSLKTQQMFVEFLQSNTSNWNYLRKKYRLTGSTEIKEEQDFSTTVESTDQFESNFIHIFSDEEKNLVTKGESSQENLKEEEFEDNNHEELAEIDALNGFQEKNLNIKICDIKIGNLEESNINRMKTKDKISKSSKGNKSKCKKDGKYDFTEFQCTLCEKKFSKQGGLTVHMKIKHSILKDPYKCKFCDKTFERRSRLEIHENAHLPTEERKQLSCPHCEKKFNSESGRWSHIHSVHDKKKAVICEECGKEFSTKHHLVKHKISHSQEKNLQCPHCPAKFKAKVGLTAHIEIHGESFPCAICGVLLNTKQLLKKHMIVHSDVKDFKCNFCNKDFKRSKELNYHLITHIGIKPFECRICNQKFVHDMTYRRHLKATHPIQFAEMVAKGERISSRNFPPPEQLKAINEAAKHTQ